MKDQDSTTTSDVVVSMHEAKPGRLRSYLTGYGLSIILTIMAYLVVINHLFGGWKLILSLISLGVVQLFIQLVFFLHLGRGSNARWNVAVLLFMLLVVLIIVVGSLWIMSNLNYRMTPQSMTQYMNNQSGM